MKDKSKQDKIFLIISGVLGALVVAGAVYLYFGAKNNPPADSGPQSSEAAPAAAETKPVQPTYKNAKGEPWRLTAADDRFKNQKKI